MKNWEAQMRRRFGVTFRLQWHGEDGVYVDVSVRKNQTRLGFVIRRGRFVSSFSTDDECKDSNSGERQAVHLARRIYPDAPLYSDHADTVVKLGARFVPRNRNWGAHNAARSTGLMHNYIPREDLELALIRGHVWTPQYEVSA